MISPEKYRTVRFFGRPRQSLCLAMPTMFRDAFAEYFYEMEIKNARR
jgi:hypothetical protein